MKANLALPLHTNTALTDGQRLAAAPPKPAQAQRAKETMEQALGEHASTVKDDKAAPAAAVANGVEAKDEAQGEDKSKATAVPSTELSSVEGIPAEYHSTVSAGPAGPGYVTDYATLSLPSVSTAPLDGMLVDRRVACLHALVL